MAESRSALLRVLLVCVRICLESVLSHRFLILDTCHPGILYLREQVCEDPWLFFEAKKGVREQQSFGKHWIRQYANSNFSVEAAVTNSRVGCLAWKGRFSLGITAGIIQCNFDVLLTVSLSVTLANDQLDAQFVYFIVRLLQSSTCFEQRRAHRQEVKLY